MSQQTTSFNTPWAGGAAPTFSRPSNLISTLIQVQVCGSPCGGPGALIGGYLDPSLLPITVVVGSTATPFPNVDGGQGFSGGGAGTGHSSTGNSAGGGGSSAILSSASGSPAVVIEAGGGNGLNAAYGGGIVIISGTPTHVGPFTWYGGSGGGFASQTPQTTGSPWGYQAGSGGASGGNGGNDSTGAGTGGTGYGIFGSGANGNAGVTGSAPGAGVGSGGLITPANLCGASFASSDVQRLTVQDGWGLSAQVNFIYHVADAPNAPTLVSPTSGEFVDGANEDQTFTGTYSTPGSDTGALEAVTLKIVHGATTQYWNGSALQGSPVAITPTTGLGATNGGTFTVVIPAGILSDNVTYSYTFATWESLLGLEGAFATSVSFDSVQFPSIVITAPTQGGFVNTLTPTISWNDTIPSGSQIDYRVVIYETASAPEAPPHAHDTTAVYDTNTVSFATTSFTLAVADAVLQSIKEYTAFVMIFSTGLAPSPWERVDFFIQLSALSTPVLTATPTIEPATGMPAPRLSETAVRAWTIPGTLPASPSVTGTNQFAEYQGDYVGDGSWEDIITDDVTTIVSGSNVLSATYDFGAPFNTPLAYRVRNFVTIPAFSSGGIDYPTMVIVSPWSNEADVSGGLPSTQWWIVPPSVPLTSMPLHRLPSSGSTSSNTSLSTPAVPATPQGLVASIVIDEQEQMGVFRPFGKGAAVVVHGDIWEAEFDLNLYFESTAEWEAFRTIRDIQAVVLLKSDMEGAFYWVTIGPDLNPGILKMGDRRTNPTRGITVHCVPTDPYTPPSP